MVALKNSVPKESDQNGLYELEARLLRSPRTLRLVIGVVDCAKIVTDPRTREKQATVGVLRLEEVVPGDVTEVERLFKRAVSHRLGETVMPIDLERALESIFSQGYWVDTETGEIHVPELEDDPGALFSTEDMDSTDDAQNGADGDDDGTN